MIHEATRATPSSTTRAAITSLIALAGLGLGGCEWDSYIDPSVVGRWEHTPTVVPILDGLPMIEESSGPLVELSEVTADDLVPVVEEYRIGPGDQLEIVLWDIPIQNNAATYPRAVDARGFVDLPQLGPVYVDGMSVDEAQDVIADAMRGLVADPLVSVVVGTQRQKTFTIMGAVSAAGPYFIPEADYRLLDALASAGGFAEGAPYVHVIRQVPLDSNVEGATDPGIIERNRPADAVPPTGEELIDVVDDILGEGEGAQPAVMPAAFGDGRTAAVQSRGRRQPEGQPPVDLVEENRIDRQPESNTPWVFINGEWVRAVRRPQDAQAGQQRRGDSQATPAEPQLVTQRVIKVPTKALLAGDAQYNIVIRGGDIVRVPGAEAGNVYMAGQVARPGVYQLPGVGRLTLTRAVTAAGGLSGTAIPERVDITRMVGDDRQATIRLDLRAIEEGTHPDVFLKPDDRINVGTNFWALPLAVIRNGFRFTYGFGFLLDRNFGNDVFGPPPRSATIN